MDLDRHIPGDGPLHHFDARLKLVLVFVAIVAIALVPAGSFFVLIGSVLLLALLSAISGLGPLRLIRGSWIVLPFAIVVIPLAFTRTGAELASIDLGPVSLSVSREGLIAAATIVMKSWTSVQVALLLTYTTPFERILDALRALRVPTLIVSTIGAMYRYLAVIGDEAGRMRRARAARSGSVEGRESGGSIAWRARVTGSLVGSLFIRAYERSERVHLAMLARGGAAPPPVAFARPDPGSLLAFGAALAAIGAVLAIAFVGPVLT